MVKSRWLYIGVMLGLL